MWRKRLLARRIRLILLFSLSLSEEDFGLLTNTTSLEAEWTGRLGIELGNLSDLPIRFFVNEGIGQVSFFESDKDCDVSSEDRGG